MRSFLFFSLGTLFGFAFLQPAYHALRFAVEVGQIRHRVDRLPGFSAIAKTESPTMWSDTLRRDIMSAVRNAGSF